MEIWSHLSDEKCLIVEEPLATVMVRADLRNRKASFEASRLLESS